MGFRPHHELQPVLPMVPIQPAASSSPSSWPESREMGVEAVVTKEGEGVFLANETAGAVSPAEGGGEEDRSSHGQRS